MKKIDYNFLKRKDQTFLITFICLMLLLSVYASIPLATSQSSEPFASTEGSMETAEPPNEQEAKVHEERLQETNQLKSETNSDKKAKTTQTALGPAPAQGSHVEFYVDQPLGYIPFEAPGAKVTINVMINTSGIADGTADGVVGWGVNIQVDPDVLDINLTAPPPPPFPPPPPPATVIGAEAGYFLFEYGLLYGITPTLMAGSSDPSTGYWRDLAETFIPNPGHGAGDYMSASYPKLVTLEVTSKSATQPCLIDLVSAYYKTADANVYPADTLLDGHYGTGEPPEAEFIYTPSTPRVGDTVTFNATASYDVDGSIVSYEWDFGDGTTGTGEIVTHVYTAEGPYNVTLTVTDDDGLTDMRTASLWVSAALPHGFASTGTYLKIGIDSGAHYADYDVGYGFQYPHGFEHAAIGWWGEGFTFGYVVGVNEFLATSYEDGPGVTNLVWVSETIIADTPDYAIYEVVLETADGRVELVHNFHFYKDTKFVILTTRISNIGTDILSGARYRRIWDMDVDNSAGGDGFNVDLSRNMLYAWETHYVALAAYSGTPPTEWDIDAWDDTDVYSPGPNVYTGPFPAYGDYNVRLEWVYSSIAPGETVEIAMYNVGGDSKADLDESYALAETKVVPREHELVVTLEAPTNLKPGDSSLLNATVYNRGLSNETDVELSLLINDILVSNVTISELQNGTSHTLNYLWTPTLEGTYNVTAHVPPVPDEEFTGNNLATKMVTVSWIAHVLVYTDDYAVPTSSRYPILALDNLGMPYTHYADDPWGFLTALTSQSWDLVVVSHNNYFAFGDNWEELEQYVLDGGLLVLSTFDVDGSHSEPTTLWSTLGVQWSLDMPYPEPVHRWMPTHPIFTSPNTIGDLTYYVEGYSDDGDHVAAITGTPIAGFTTSPTTGSAAIVVGNVHRTVLMNFLMCEFRYDEDGDGKLDTVELWENAITFVITPLEHDLAVSLETPRFLEPGDSSLLNATVYNRGLSNETDVELYLLIDATIVNNIPLPELVTGTSYTIDHLWTPAVEAMYNITAYAPPVPNENITANNVLSVLVNVQYPVALFKNVDPWDDPANERALSTHGTAYTVFSSSDFGLVDLSSYSKVIIASDQDQTFYNAMDAYRWWFEDYVSGGGVLEIHAADMGWHGGHWVGTLPGGLQWIGYYADSVTIVDPTHAVVTTPNPITDAELDGWLASVHGYFGTYPADSHIVIVEDSTGYPAYLEFRYGAGVVVASSQTLEWAYSHGYSLVLENSLLYIPMRPPVASFVYAPAAPYVGDIVVFNASASSDPDGAIIDYAWDFGDGGSNTGIAVAHAYWAEGTFPINLTVTDDQGLTDTALANITVRHRLLTLKLSGEHDYLFMEAVKIRVAALVTDAETMAPISDANVTIEIYDAEGNRWIADNMTARLSGRGIYEWDSTQTIRELMSRGPLSKGVYLVHVQASYRGGPVAADILEFHIDPPSEAPIPLQTIVLLLAGALATAIPLWFIDHKRLARKHGQPGKTA